VAIVALIRPILTRQESKSAQLDRALVVKGREGDPAAIAELWRRHFPSACGAARRIVGCSDPDEAASEAFLATVRAIRSGHGEAVDSFRAYLCSVAARFAVRNSGRRSIFGEPFDTDLPAVADHTMAPASLDPDVVGGWDQRPDRLPRVLWLTVVERRTPADVGEKVGMTPEAVATVADQTRRRLRDLQPPGRDLDRPPMSPPGGRRSRRWGLR
jgi:DNA-directed RNA polymerase specialized sigma24 family protein